MSKSCISVLGRKKILKGGLGGSASCRSEVLKGLSFGLKTSLPPFLSIPQERWVWASLVESLIWWRACRLWSFQCSCQWGRFFLGQLQVVLVCCRIVLVWSCTGRPGRLCRVTVCGHQLCSRVLISLGVCAYIYRHGTYLNEVILK